MICFGRGFYIIGDHLMNIIDILGNLDLTSQEIEVLIALFKLGESTITAISKASGINRTTLYRVLKNLKSEGYCIQKLKLNNSIYLPIELDFLIKKMETKEKDLNESRRELPRAIKALQGQTKSQQIFKTTTYEGKEECKQLMWNSLVPNAVVLSFGFETTSNAVGIKFLTEWLNEAYRRGQKHKMIANKGTYQVKSKSSLKSKYDFLPEVKGNSEFFEKREISKEVMTIPFETFIYEDTYAILQWQGDQVFGFEIVNSDIAKTERQIFWHLWKSTTPYINKS